MKPYMVLLFFAHYQCGNFILHSWKFTLINSFPYYASMDSVGIWSWTVVDIYQVFLPWDPLAYNLILTSTIQTVSVSKSNQQQANTQANSGNNMDPTDD